jgi:hypothetical protein
MPARSVTRCPAPPSRSSARNRINSAFPHPPGAFLGHDILIIAAPGDVGATIRQFAPDFASLTPAPALVVAHRGDILLILPTLLGHDLLKAP